MATSTERTAAGTDVFAYGTLTRRARAAAVLDTFSFCGAATLRGLHRVDGRYPTLAPGGSTDGRILRTPNVSALDAYEGVDAGLYVRVKVPRVRGGERQHAERETDEGRESGGDATRSSAAEQVAVYVGDPDRLDAPAEWPGDGPFRRRVREYLAANDVVVRQ